MGYETREKIIPTIDFLDALSINNYGRLRQLLLDYGKSYTYRMQIVYSSVFVLTIFMALKEVMEYFTASTMEAQQKKMKEMVIIVIYSLPLLYFLGLMFLKTAQINEFFDIQRQLISKIKFVIRTLQNIPFDIYFSEDHNPKHIETHNDYI